MTSDSSNNGVTENITENSQERSVSNETSNNIKDCSKNDLINNETNNNIEDCSKNDLINDETNNNIEDCSKNDLINNETSNNIKDCSKKDLVDNETSNNIKDCSKKDLVDNETNNNIEDCSKDDLINNETNNNIEDCSKNDLINDETSNNIEDCSKDDLINDETSNNIEDCSKDDLINDEAQVNSSKTEDTDEGTLIKKEQEERLISILKQKRKILISRSNLSCLLKSRRINDEVVNAYISFLHNKFGGSVGSTNTFFMEKLIRDGNEEAVKWEGIKGISLSNFKKFIIPISNGYHWFLVCLRIDKSKMYFLDSMSTPVPKAKYIKALNNFLAFQKIGKLTPLNLVVPKQKNSYDCGTYLLFFAECLFNDVNEISSFTQKEAVKFKKKIYDILYPNCK